MNLKLYLINTNVFLYKKILPFFYGGLSIFCLILISGPNGTHGYLTKVDSQLWGYFISSIALLIFIILTIKSMFSNELVNNNKFMILNDEFIELQPLNRHINLRSVDKVEFLFDSSSFKKYEKRDALTGGGNNWIILHMKQKIYKFEIYIESKKMEEDLLDLSKNLSTPTSIGKSTNSLLKSIMQF